MTVTIRTIHLKRVPAKVCTDRDQAVQELADFLTTAHVGPASFSSALADHSGNVTCPRCLAWLRANAARRKKMERE